MSNRIIQLNSKLADVKKVKSLCKKFPIIQYWEISDTSKIRTFNILIKTEFSQAIIDDLGKFIKDDKEARIIVLPVEAVIPKEEPEQKEEKKKDQKSKKALSREELYEDVHKGANLDSNFIFLVIFSTIVAAVGLIEDNPAVVIGAMVIAPMLGSNLALALGTALGDLDLAKKAIKTNLIGFGLTLFIAVLVGLFAEINLESKEILSRTTVGMGSITLALASGAAGVLSLTSGVSTVLVGVMVAVALLPPATVLGLMLGIGEFNLAAGAGILLGINVVCVNISAKLVFYFKKIEPKSWYEKKRTKKRMFWFLAFWIIILAALAILVYYKNKVEDGKIRIDANPLQKITNEINNKL